MINSITKTRLAFFMTLMVLAIPISMGCFESPFQSSVNNDPVEQGDTINQADTGNVNDTTQHAEPETQLVVQRNSDEAGTDTLSGLIDFTVKLISNTLGGTISLLDMTLDIPANSLDRMTSITVEMPNPVLYIYDFGPDGLQFNIPATITISYDYADLSTVDESQIRLAWWDEANATWVAMPCTVDESSKTITGQIEHFSSYGLISD